MRLLLDLLALVRALSTLRRVLSEYVEYYNESRCHMALDGDAPEQREVAHGDGQIVAKTEAPIGAVGPPHPFRTTAPGAHAGYATDETQETETRARDNHQPARPRGS